MRPTPPQTALLDLLVQSTNADTCICVLIPVRPTPPQTALLALLVQKYPMLTPVYMCPDTCPTDRSDDFFCVSAFVACFTSIYMFSYLPRQRYVLIPACGSAAFVTCFTSTQVQMLTPVNADTKMRRLGRLRH